MLRKAVFLLLVLTLVGTSLVGCQPAGTGEVEGAQLKDGVYEVAVLGHNGEMVVKTTISDGRLADVEVVSHQESRPITNAAINELPKTIVEHNSLNVDAASGATVTSAALLNAVKMAIEQAGGDPQDFMTEIEKEPEEDLEITTEVLVVGAGGAGLAAANAAIRNGADVLVIGKMSAAGGATSVSGGVFIGGASNLQRSFGVEGDSPEQIYQDLLAGAGNNYEPLLRLFAEPWVD